MSTLHGPNRDVRHCRLQLCPQQAEKILSIRGRGVDHRVTLLRSFKTVLDCFHIGHDSF